MSKSMSEKKKASAIETATDQVRTASAFIDSLCMHICVMGVTYSAFDFFDIYDKLKQLKKLRRLKNSMRSSPF